MKPEMVNVVWDVVRTNSNHLQSASPMGLRGRGSLGLLMGGGRIQNRGHILGDSTLCVMAWANTWLGSDAVSPLPACQLCDTTLKAGSWAGSGASLSAGHHAEGGQEEAFSA